jgi:hypothetical protein
VERFLSATTPPQEPIPQRLRLDRQVFAAHDPRPLLQWRVVEVLGGVVWGGSAARYAKLRTGVQL